jgi:hypothetical protein
MEKSVTHILILDPSILNFGFSNRVNSAIYFCCKVDLSIDHPTFLVTAAPLHLIARIVKFLERGDASNIPFEVLMFSVW